MTKLDMLYNLANKHNIQIHFFDLTATGCLGLNIEKENMPSMIFLDINMTKLDMLYNLANKHNIQIHFFDLTATGCLGLNIEKENMPSMIFLDISLKKDKNKHIEVLAEELGHYFTTVGISVGNIKTYSDKLELNKVENKADKWATNFFS